jgi:hypothetical protein
MIVKKVPQAASHSTAACAHNIRKTELLVSPEVDLSQQGLAFSIYLAQCEHAVSF